MLRLSEPIYNGRSIAAIGVAAHEAGHAVQQHVGYAPMSLRAGLVPVANIGSGIAPYIVLGGLWTQITGLAWIGVILFAGATLFALVTLPVEYNASARARNCWRIGADHARRIRRCAEDAQRRRADLRRGFRRLGLQLLYYVMLVTGMGGRRRE